MERDFMGLRFKDSEVVKEESDEGCKDSPVFFKCPQAQWPLTNTINPSNMFQSGENQGNVNYNREGGAHFSITNYPIQQSAKVFTGMNQGISLSMNNSFCKSQLAGVGQNIAAASTNPHYLGGVQVAYPHSNPSLPLQAATHEKLAPAQMTIFYGGVVNVFDDLSPEMAQAIMFLAGNGSSTAYNVAQPRRQVVTFSPKPVIENVFGAQPLNALPCSGRSSPTSVSSHPMRQSVGGEAKNDKPTKTSGGSTSPVNEAPKIVTSVGHVAATTMIQSAVPQARKASLARFLEKRKERAMSSAPYNIVSKKTAETATTGFNGACISENSGSGAAPMCTSKDSSN